MEKKPKKFDFNVIVLGAGSGGLVASYIAAAMNAKVALIEKNKMGGDCLNTGCVPSKALIRSAQFVHDVNNSSNFGIDKADIEYDFSKVMERVQRVIKKIEPHDSVERFTGLGVECLQGVATILDPYRVELNGKTLTTMNIIVATGGEPNVPKIPGIDKINYVTSDTVWEIRERPKRLVVLGGGPIGSELAQTFSRLGSSVTIVNRGPHILSKEDSDVALLVEESFRKENIEVLNDHEASEFKKDGEENILIAKQDGKEKRIPFDLALVALGRKANVNGFGLENVGVELSKFGTIAINDFVQTNIPNIYACGDVAGPFQFTHFASHQAGYAVLNALLRPLKKFKADYSVVPWCTYTDPEVATVGLSEKAAKEQGVKYEVTEYGVDDLDRAITDESDFGKVKVITKKGTDKILGATIVASHAGNIIPEFVTALKYGIGLNKILNTIHIYPTMAEMNRFAAGTWKKNHVPELFKKLGKKFFDWRRG